MNELMALAGFKSCEQIERIDLGTITLPFRPEAIESHGSDRFDSDPSCSLRAQLCHYTYPGQHNAVAACLLRIFASVVCGTKKEQREVFDP